jgi:hypothetical protein
MDMNFVALGSGEGLEEAREFWEGDSAVIFAGALELLLNNARVAANA